RAVREEQLDRREVRLLAIGGGSGRPFLRAGAELRQDRPRLLRLPFAPDRTVVRQRFTPVRHGEARLDRLGPPELIRGVLEHVEVHRGEAVDEMLVSLSGSRSRELDRPVLVIDRLAGLLRRGRRGAGRKDDGRQDLPPGKRPLLVHLSPSWLPPLRWKVERL